MMRPLSSVWLALSLAVNAALLGVCLTREPGEREDTSRAAKPAAGVKRASESGAMDVSGLAPETVARIGAGDEATLRDLLLACGMEPKAVRWLVAAAVGGRFEAEKVAAMMRQRGAGWWKEQPNWWSYPERKKIEERQDAEIERLVGTLPSDEYPWVTERWNFLPAEKRAALRSLDRDYEALEEKLPPQPWLPHEREMFETLSKEKRRDMEAMLSDEELAEYDFRDDAESFARNLDIYGITDTELRALWLADKERDAAMQEVEARYGKWDPFAVPASDKPIEADEAARRLSKDYEARKKEILSAERIARGNREADQSFKGIVKVTDKFGLGRERAVAIYAVIDRAQAIHEAEEMNNDERARLNAAAWAEIGEQVPPDALRLLMNSVGFRHYWLKASPD